MHIILGATGHIGSVVANQLLQKGEEVTIITRSENNRSAWQQKGAGVAVVDVLDTDQLKKVFASGERLFLLNPTGDLAGNMEVQENATLDSILTALRSSAIKKVVAESTYDAQEGSGIADLGVLHRMEQELAVLPVSVTIIRGAYYMSNWDIYLEAAKEKGKLFTLLPPDFKLPMVAPQDIGVFATSLLTQPVEDTGLYFVEGPEQYSPNDVAASMSKALQRPVQTEQIPAESWKDYLVSAGLSEATAISFANMTKLTIEDKYEASNPVRGATTIEKYIAALVNQ